MASTSIKAITDIPTVAQLYRESALRKVASSSPSDSSISRSAPINSRVGLIRGDITTLQLDAIVNAANPALLGGGGVDGAIHRAAGPELLDECRGIGGCSTGDSCLTRGYKLPAKHVIHTVGPIYDGHSPQTSENLLRSCYETSLRLAVSSGIKTLAFAAISTGIYGYPSQDAARVACETVRKFLHNDGGALDRVVFVTFEPKDVTAYNDALPKYFPPEEGA
ncbi:Appr-1-p processing [Metarhizium album ARSEF 1941]|uniref:Appr-1-p processing n=1 Tax=Metarhizium album (strain ARSEF 1941) TaxID=1081103 RepID=A0A0B2WTE1_METAS|nr:Appr-1-p processing [Metarhizium album ARSEF 1941]KHN99331.1 Appr-1-p processing [Metarhizium album ARSEF 1941]